METTPGKRVQMLREAKGYTSLTAFAEFTKIKVGTLSALEKDKSSPSLETMAKIIEAFPDTSLDWLVTGFGSMFKADRALTPAPPASQIETATPAAATDEPEPPTPASGLRKHQPSYEELAAENIYLHKTIEELRTDKGQLWQQNAQLIELGKTDASSDAAAPVDSFAWLAPKPHRQVNGLVRYDQPESTCAHYDMATGQRVEELQVAKAA